MIVLILDKFHQFTTISVCQSILCNLLFYRNLSTSFHINFWIFAEHLHLTINVLPKYWLPENLCWISAKFSHATKPIWTTLYRDSWECAILFHILKRECPLGTKFYHSCISPAFPSRRCSKYININGSSFETAPSLHSVGRLQRMQRVI